MSFPLPEIKILWARGGNQCAFPGCVEELTYDNVSAETGDSKATVLGEQAHIRSHRPKGPRYDPDFPTDKHHTYENAILLCPNHHSRIDANDGAGYGVNELVAMRNQHESNIKRSRNVDGTLRAYMAQQWTRDDKVMFEQVDLNGPSVDAMFVDVPIAARTDTAIAEVLEKIAEAYPGDTDGEPTPPEQIVTGAAQALLNPRWYGNALIVGGPGQGKSTLLQYITQYHRARKLGRPQYSGSAQQLAELSDITRFPIRLDLRDYVTWAKAHTEAAGDGRRKFKRKRTRGGDEAAQRRWPALERFIAEHIAEHAAEKFTAVDLSFVLATQPVLLALDGLDEVANLPDREAVAVEVVSTAARTEANALDLVILIASRPGAMPTELLSSVAFPRLTLQRLTFGLRLQYLHRWAEVAKLKPESRSRLETDFTDNQNVPHVRELASYPMQLAILLHLLHRRGLLPQQRTDLYSEYLTTFLDREQRENKEPLLAQERQLIETCHAYIGWYIQTRVETGESNGSIHREELRRVLAQHLSDRAGKAELAGQLFTAFTSRVLCLAERDTDWFQFDVQSLREYFAATYIFDEGSRNQRDEHLREMLARPYWANACRFFVGKFSPGEVRDLRWTLSELATSIGMENHPVIRSMGVHFLNDRTHDRQPDKPIQSLVDYVLGGPGVMYANDGLLDVAGSGLRLSEGAGRAQVLAHTSVRLTTSTSPTERTALARLARTHADPASGDDLARFWFEQFAPTESWLATAADLEIFGSLASARETQLAHALAGVDLDHAWALNAAVAGGYDGRSSDIIDIAFNDINDGAADSLSLWWTATPLGEMVAAAHLASGASEARIISAASNRRTRRRQGGPIDHLYDLSGAVAELAKQPRPNWSVKTWAERIELIARLFGPGWVLTRALCALPQTLELEAVAAVASPEIRGALEALVLAREHRADGTWWAQRMTSPGSALAGREVLLEMLSLAQAPAVAGASAQLSELTDALRPREFASIVGALVRSRVRVNRPFQLAEILRRNQGSFSLRALWLLRLVSSTGSIEQIGKRLVGHLPELLGAGVGDARELVRAAGQSKVVKFTDFDGHRTALPIGGWSSDINLGAIRPATVRGVLAQPERWPGDLVTLAAQAREAEYLADVPALAAVAAQANWFHAP